MSEIGGIGRGGWRYIEPIAPIAKPGDRPRKDPQDQGRHPKKEDSPQGGKPGAVDRRV